MTLNVGGLNELHKVVALKQTLRDLDVVVAVITQTHLSDSATNNLRIPGFSIETKGCRAGSLFREVFTAVSESAHSPQW